MGNRTLPTVVRQASRRDSWNTRPTRGSGPVTVSPSSATVPAPAAIRPAITRSSVLLPQPLGPIRATTSRGRMSRSIPSRAWTGRAPPNVSDTPEIRIPAPGPGAWAVDRREAGAGVADGTADVAGSPAVAIPTSVHSPSRDGAGGTQTHPGRDGPALAFSHPDCTVGSGERGCPHPGSAALPGPRPRSRSWARPAPRDPTTGRDSHPAPKALARSYHPAAGPPPAGAWRPATAWNAGRSAGYSAR
jgi:hypothetical protein